MARSTPLLLLALLAVAWVSQADAQAQDPSVAEAATLKHRKHGKYDKEPDKYYEKHEGHRYEEKPYHGKEYYSGEKPSYSGEEYSSGYTGPYSGDSYSGYSGEYPSDPTTPGGTPPAPRHIDIKLQLAEKLNYYGENTRRAVSSRVRIPKTGPKGQPVNRQTPALRSNWLGAAFFYQQMDVYCPAEESYSYKHDADSTRTTIADYYNYYYAASAPLQHTECYGQEAEVVGVMETYMYFNNEAASCNKVLKDDTELEMFGKVASTPAMFKLPDGTLAKTASAQYGEYYDEHAHAVCGLAFIFNATGVFGTNAFFNYVYDIQGTPTATSYAYAGSVHYLAGFNGRTIDGKTSVEVPLAPGAEAGNLPEATWKLLESKCKHHRHSLPVVKYGLLDLSLRRVTWLEGKTIHDDARAAIIA